MHGSAESLEEVIPMIAPVSLMGFVGAFLTGFAVALGWRTGSWICGKLLR
jgi:hypothetical protein